MKRKIIMPDAAKYDVEFAGSRGRQIKVIAGAKGIWCWHFKCGSRPIEPGGGIQLFCEVPKFWMATCLQADSSDAPGYICAHGSKNLNYILKDYAHHWKALSWVTIGFPGGMQPGQEICVQFGSEISPYYAIAHKYYYAPVSWRVDYKGEGVFYRIWPPMSVRIVPGLPAKLYLVAPSIVGENELFRVRVRVEDINSNIGAHTEAMINLELIDSAGHAVDKLRREMQVDSRGTFTSNNWRIRIPGVYRVRAHVDDLPQTLSNPIIVKKQPRKQLAWGDCHCHTVWADGVGTFDYNISYARDEAFLDIFGFAEHLSNVPQFSTEVFDKSGTDWAVLGPDMAETLRRAYEPERFVTILGNEYTPDVKTSRTGGDFCIFSPSDYWPDIPMAHEYFDLIDIAERYGCLLIPHVGGRMPKWQDLPLNPRVTPLVEIASMHGHFERYAQQGLQLGHKLGFVGMGDGHFGMPGYDNWAQHGRTPNLTYRNYSVQSAVTGFWVNSLTREAVFEAMRSRCTYATSGQRILLHFSIEDAPMGSELVTKSKPHLQIEVNGTAPIALVDIIRGDRRIYRVNGYGQMDISIDWTDSSPLSKETWYYIRVIQEDFTLGWTSPIWVTYKGSSSTAGTDLVKLPTWDAPPYWPQDCPWTCDPEYTRRLKSIFAKRKISHRFVDFHQVGVFTESRGRFALFRAKDSERSNMPIHIHLYIDFPDDRLYIADGESDFGTGLY